MTGKIISELRKKYGLTQNELADKLQVSGKTVSKWESGSGEPSIEFLLPIAELFGVSVEYLLSGKISTPTAMCFSENGLVSKDEFASFSIGQIRKLSNADLSSVPIAWLIDWSNKNHKDIIYEVYHERLNGYFTSKYEEGLDKLLREYKEYFYEPYVEGAFGWREYSRFAKFRDKFIELNYLKEEYSGNTPRYSFIEKNKAKLLEALKEI